jgi:Na+/proline symporter
LSVVLLLTIYATAHSGNLILGFPGAAYRRGFAFLLSAGLVLMIFVAFHLIAPLRPLGARHGFVTPGDLFRFRFGKSASGRRLRVAVGALMSVALANFLLAQLIALGHVTYAVTGGALPYSVGVLGFTAVIAAYEHVGGMRAVAWSDAVQGLLLFSGMTLLLVWFVGESWGIGDLSARVAALRPEAVAVPPLRTTLNACSIALIVGLGAMSYPHAIQRIFAARSDAAFKRAMGWMGFLSLFMTATITLIGVAAIPYLRGLGEIESDRVIPLLLEVWAQSSPWAQAMASLVFVAALAAIMSTADSVLLSLSSVLVSDVWDSPREDPQTTRRGKRAALAVMLLAATLALVPKLTLFRLLELKMELLMQCAPALVLCARRARVRADALFGGIVVGTTAAVGLALSGHSLLYGVHAGVIGWSLNLAVVWAWPRPPRDGAMGGAESRGV